ncbi:MAG: phosphate-starvation-inducible PsiE family protein [Anaerosomatales bacterium]|nr:phosphate-starvation-inducible PsiE family protein [Anaerosomatales bacterium]
MDAIIGVLVFLVLISLAWAALTVASDLIRSIGQPSFERFKAVTLEILTIFIFIEMFTLLLDYVKNQRLCLTNIVDATLAVVLRELWVQIWAGESAWELLLALSGVVVALAVLRVASMKYSVQEA